MRVLNSAVSLWPAVFATTQFSHTEPCGSALPGASRLWVHHFPDHTLPGLVLLLGEGPLRRESSLLLVRHHCGEEADAMGHCRVVTGADSHRFYNHYSQQSHSRCRMYRTYRVRVMCSRLVLLLYCLWLFIHFGSMIKIKYENSWLVSPCQYFS